MITSATKNIVKTEEALHREFLIVSESIRVDDVSLFPAEFVQVNNFQIVFFVWNSPFHLLRGTLFLDRIFFVIQIHDLRTLEVKIGLENCQRSWFTHMLTLRASQEPKNLKGELLRWKSPWAYLPTVFFSTVCLEIFSLSLQKWS